MTAAAAIPPRNRRPELLMAAGLLLWAVAVLGTGCANALDGATRTLGVVTVAQKAAMSAWDAYDQRRLDDIVRSAKTKQEAHRALDLYVTGERALAKKAFAGVDASAVLLEAAIRAAKAGDKSGLGEALQALSEAYRELVKTLSLMGVSVSLSENRQAVQWAVSQ